MRDYIPELELFVGIVALYFAWRHITDLKRQTAEVKGIGLAISTAYIDKFPDYFPTIVELLGRAKVKIEIFCDFPAYGVFSNAAAFTDYEHQLKKKPDEGASVFITCLSDKKWHACIRDQFASPEADSWQKRKGDAAFLLKLTRFLKKHDQKINPVDLDIEPFVTHLQNENLAMLSTLRGIGKVTVKLVERHIPVFFWLIDEHEAIFALASHSDVEYGFRTKDPRLIGALQEMRNGYLDTQAS